MRLIHRSAHRPSSASTTRRRMFAVDFGSGFDGEAGSKAGPHDFGGFGERPLTAVSAFHNSARPVPLARPRGDRALRHRAIAGESVATGTAARRKRRQHSRRRAAPALANVGSFMAHPARAHRPDPRPRPGAPGKCSLVVCHLASTGALVITSRQRVVQLTLRVGEKLVRCSCFGPLAERR